MANKNDRLYAEYHMLTIHLDRDLCTVAAELKRIIEIRTMLKLEDVHFDSDHLVKFCEDVSEFRDITVPDFQMEVDDRLRGCVTPPLSEVY